MIILLFPQPFAVLLHALDWIYHFFTWSALLAPAGAIEEKYRLFHEFLQEKNKNKPCDHEIFVYSLNFENCILEKRSVKCYA